MFSAADLIDVLRTRRTLRSIRPETPGQLPEGWRRWLEAMPVRRKAVTGASADTFVDAFLGRALRTPPPVPAMPGRLQAFSSLWNQSWSPPSRDERGLRVSGMAASVTLHVLLSAALVWLMDARFLLLPPVAEETDAQVVEVEFIGRGTPADTGGAQAAAGPEAPAAAPLPAPAPSDPVAPPAPDLAEAAPPVAVLRPAPREAPAMAVAVPDIQVQAPRIPERPVPPPTPAQPLAVGEQPSPDDVFLLPPPTPAVTVTPAVAPPSLVADAPVVPVRDVPEPVTAPPVPTLSTTPTTVAVLPTIVPEPRVRPVDAPVAVMTPDFARATRPATAVASPEISTRVPDVRARDVPAPTRPDAVATGEEAPIATEAGDATSAEADVAPAQAAAPADARDGAETAPATPAGRDAGATAATHAPGRGPDPTEPPGAWESATRDDDWGDAVRDRPGGRAGRDGLFDDSGRPRLADTGPAPGEGRPPGSVEETVSDFDRAGEWMQRPAFPYEPTRFDRFWIPGGTLLEEWVRRGVRELTVRIPGTSKRLKCVVSVLQLGGGCWVADPNLNEQPSSGRPAPEVPFRPDLFEDPSVLEPAPPGG